ncbi:hypothetical protein [Vagococcus sp. WN89Y]|uniref:hypothetical protein n=1 Tax=Vagococcus sp. WN89Y TaxID=3457258 RepID=UPI003FCDA8B2
MSIGGWLFELGHYRDLVIHSAPINIASHRLYEIHEAIPIADNKTLPSVRFPLPANPDQLYSERCKKNDFNKYIEQVERLSRISMQERGKYDCLEYALKVFGLLCKLALEISKESPFEPMQQEYIRKDNEIIFIVMKKIKSPKPIETYLLQRMLEVFRLEL